jgi:two-component system, sensor histidine kinase PhcS
MTHVGTTPGLIATDAAAPVRPRLDLAARLSGVSSLPPDQQERFRREDRVLTLRNVRNLCAIAMILMVSSVPLDYFSYPHLLLEFFALRLFCAVCLVPVWIASHTWIGHRYYRLFTVVVPMLPALFISLMIKAAHDPGSGYYAGLTLCLVAIGFMFHWTFVESIVALGLTMVFYFSANAWLLWEAAPKEQLAGFATNTIFILLNGTVIACGSLYHHRIRVREFLTRVEVEEQREALAEKNSDISTALQQLRETESQLYQSEKLASLGRMSAGLIHEINNPLNFANQALFVLKKKGKHLPDTEREHFERIVTDIKEGIGRVSTIVSDLRSFSHPVVGENTRVDITDILQQTARLMAGPLKDADVPLTTSATPELYAKGDHNHLIQVLINLVQNAIDSLRTRPSPAIHITAAQSDDRVQIEVSDNGCGIPTENLPRIFDPFFTTKDVGEGMGMGLSICFRMIQQMHGTIDVHSTPASGTTFTLRLPLP